VRNDPAAVRNERNAARNEQAAAGDDPVRAAVRRDEAERLKRAVEALSPPLRETVLLCYTHGLTHDEAAEAMGIPLGTVKSRLHSALEELRSRLTPE
jgi:RNA polymerase sigma-70 factor, ECF subfamily